MKYTPEYRVSAVFEIQRINRFTDKIHDHHLLRSGVGDDVLMADIRSRTLAPVFACPVYLIGHTLRAMLAEEDCK